ncbi:MAG: hypothetical protein AAGG11_16830 [Pseudomonadota bacterium]
MSTAVSSGRRRFWLRFALAGPWTFIASIITMAGMAVWLPAGNAQVDNLVIPLVLFPLIWAALFFSAYMDPNLRRAAWISVAITAVHGALVALRLLS